MPHSSSTPKLLAMANAPKRKFWITDGMRRSAARDLAEKAVEIARPADRLAAAEVFRHYPRDCHDAVPALRVWLRPGDDPLESSRGGSARAGLARSESKSLTAIRIRTALALSTIGTPAVEALDDLRAARAVERNDHARAALQSAIERLESLAPDL